MWCSLKRLDGFCLADGVEVSLDVRLSNLFFWFDGYDLLDQGDESQDARCERWIFFALPLVCIDASSLEVRTGRLCALCTIYPIAL